MVHKVFEMKYGSNRAILREAIINIGGEPLNNPNSPVYNGVTYYGLSAMGGSILDDGRFKVTINAGSKDMVIKIKSRLEKMSGIKLSDLR